MPQDEAALMRSGGEPARAAFDVPRQEHGSHEQRAARGAGAVRALAGEGLKPCPVRLVTAAEIDEWLRGARPGESFIYCTGPILVRGPTSARALKLYEDGKVDLKQARRTDCAGYDYAIERRSDPKKASARSAPVAGFDAATMTIFAKIVECAERGRRCFSNNELARLAGLATAQQAAWRVGKLAEARLVSIETVTAGPNAGWRTIVVLASGKRTKAPPPPVLREVGGG